jgi:hypothetical protein
MTFINSLNYFEPIINYNNRILPIIKKIYWGMMMMIITMIPLITVSLMNF